MKRDSAAGTRHHPKAEAEAERVFENSLDSITFL
jgi:hypothetical protein